MSFDSRLLHELAIERSTDGAVDDYNNPTQVFATLATVRALVQPKSGRELAQVNETGPVRGEYRVFMRPTDITEGDHLVRQDPDEVYQILFVADAGGIGHHLELDCTRVWPN
jgi:head-tail adaptor